MSAFLKFELGHQLKNWTFVLVTMVFFVIGFSIIGFDILMETMSEAQARINGAASIAGFQMKFIQLCVFLISYLAVRGPLKDDAAQFTDMVHVTPIKSYQLFIGRFLGVFLPGFLWVAFGTLGLFLSQFSPFVTPDTLLAPQPSYFLYPLVFYSGLTIFILSCAYTAVAWFTRSQMAVYVTAIAAFAFVNLTEALKPISDLDNLRVIIDYTGGAAESHVIQFWSVTEQETRLLPLGSLFGLNRLLWGVWALTALLLSGLYYKRRNYSPKSTSQRRIILKPAPSAQEDILPAEPLSFRAVSTGPHWAAQFWTWFKFEFISALRSWPFITLLGLALISFMTLVFLRVELTPMPVLPTSNQIVFLVSNGLSLFLLLTIIFFSAQIIWRDKTAGFKEMLDVTPSHNGVHMAVKWSVLLMLIFVVLLVAAIFAMIAQTLLGNPVIELHVYVARLIGNVGLYVILMAILALGIQTFVKDQKAGLIASGAIIFFFFMVMNRLPFNHPLIDYGNTSFGPYSDMNGFDRQSKLQGLWRAAYWGCVSCIIILGSYRLWPRGLESSVKTRIQNSRPMKAGLFSSLLAVSFVGTLVMGGFIFNGFNIRNDFEISEQIDQRLAAYEAQFGDRFYMPRPTITDLELDFNLVPETGAAQVAGTMQWENKTEVEITDVFVTTPMDRDENNVALKIKGAILNVEHPDYAALKTSGYRPYKFDPPLKSKQSVPMQFEYSIPPPRLGDRGFIRKNGTFLYSYQLLPTPGLETARIALPRKRKKYGLAPYPEMAGREDIAARSKRLFNTVPDRLTYNVTLCTAPDQIAITSGHQVRNYMEDGRRCFDYENNDPVSGIFSIASGRYAERKDRWNDVELSVYYHPDHGYNVESMIEAMKSGLETYSQTFGPYQFSQFRIAEYPYGSRAESFPNTIAFSENLGFVLDSAGADAEKGQVDLLSYVTLHELGHQWFGHQMAPAKVKGSATLSESLTQYAAAIGLEDMRGWRMAKLVRDQNLELYTSRRAGNPNKEVPLSLTEQELYLVYAKGYLAFWSLKHYLSEDVLNRSIREFLEVNTPAVPPYPTTLDLTAVIKSNAPKKFHRLIDDYLERIVTWELTFGNTPRITQTHNDAVQIDLSLKVERYVSDLKGDLDEYVEIGFFDADQKGIGFDQAFHVETVHITTSEHTLKVTLDKSPQSIVIDPRGLLIEKNEGDNHFTLTQNSSLAKN